eukprot:gene9647-biopygen19748
MQGRGGIVSDVAGDLHAVGGEQPDPGRWSAVTIRGTSQEAECVQFVMQLRSARRAGVKLCWLGVDSEVVVSAYIAAVTGNQKRRDRRQMAPYTRVIAELLTDWDAQVVVFKQSGHSLSLGNIAADSVTHGAHDLLTWQRGKHPLQLWMQHAHAGWRARLVSSPSYTVWGNTALTAAERRFAERLGVGRLWDLACRAHRKHVTDPGEGTLCLACDLGVDEPMHWLTVCRGNRTDTPGALHRLHENRKANAVTDLGLWIRDLTGADWLALAAGLMPPNVLKSCRTSAGIPGDTRTLCKRSYKLQKHAIRMGLELYTASRDCQKERLKQPDLLAPARWEMLKHLMETQVAARRKEENTIIQCIHPDSGREGEERDGVQGAEELDFEDDTCSRCQRTDVRLYVARDCCQANVCHTCLTNSEEVGQGSSPARNEKVHNPWEHSTRNNWLHRQNSSSSSGLPGSGRYHSRKPAPDLQIDAELTPSHCGDGMCYPRGARRGKRAEKNRGDFGTNPWKMGVRSAPEEKYGILGAHRKIW